MVKQYPWQLVILQQRNQTINLKLDQWVVALEMLGREDAEDLR